MTYRTSFSLLTTRCNDLIIITEHVNEAVNRSGIASGLVTILSRHTTTGVTVNEALECLESDITLFLGRLVPEDHPYCHARILRDYGSTAGNPTGHIKSLLVGNHAHLIVADGAVARGGAQEVYLCEFDGPANRTVDIVVVGD